MPMKKLYPMVLLVAAFFLSSCGDLAVEIQLPTPTEYPVKRPNPIRRFQKSFQAHHPLLNLNLSLP
jgi:hypothetical protein